MNKKIHVMQLLGILDMGGAEYGVALNLVNNLDPQKFRCSIVSMSSINEILVERVKPHVSLYCIPKGKYGLAKTMKKLISLVKKNKVDIVHTHNWATFFFGYCAVLLGGVSKFVHCEHGRDKSNMELSFKRYLLQKLFLTKTDCLIAVSKDIKNAICSKWHVSSERVDLIENSVDTKRFNFNEDQRCLLRQELNIDNDSLIIGTISVLRKVKNHQLLLKAFMPIYNKFPDCYLVIVGEGATSDIRKELELLAKKLGIDNRVYFLGLRIDTPKIMNGIDIFVNMSLFEGMSITILEAMASCLPVVASRVGGNPEIVIDNETGCLFSVDSADELTLKLECLLIDPDMRKNMSLAGRKNIEKLYSLDKMIEKYSNVYNYA